MHLLIGIAIFGWIPFTLVLFMLLTPRRAAIASVIGAWLFLPVAGFGIPGVAMTFDKTLVTSLAVFAGAILFDANTVLSFRPRWLDLPMLLWCVCPIFSSISNGLGPYDGLMTMRNQITTWGIPYFIGRIYITDLQAARDLAMGIFIGGLLYVPLCLIEIRLSPQLSSWVYGLQNDSGFAMTIRFGGYRPVVFMQHGLMLGLWMAMSSLAGVWLWMSGALKRLWDIPMAWLVIPLVITTILCKSLGALILLAAGLAALFMVKWLGTRLVVICLLLAPVVYMSIRASGRGTGDGMVSLVAELTNENRAGSLQVRFDNEDELAARAMERPLFGWGTWGDARIHDIHGKDLSITDGMWIITLGNQGLFGLIAFSAVLLLPALVACRRIHPRLWTHPAVGAVAVFALILILYMCDCLLNAMLNPVYLMVSGAMVSVMYGVAWPRSAASRPVNGRRGPAPAHLGAASPASRLSAAPLPRSKAI